MKLTARSKSPSVSHIASTDGQISQAGIIRAEALPADDGRAKIYLHPGQLYASAERCAVTTILGSCVSLCLWDPVLKIGGINHYLLPLWIGDGLASSKFGNVAVRCLVDRIIAYGSPPHYLQAKLFGGACVIDAFRNRTGRDHLGLKNVRMAEEFLHQQGIPLVGHDVGGQRGRKLIFHTDSGSAWVREL